MMKVQEAVELALWLAVKAEDRKDMNRCVEIAEKLAQQLTAEQLKAAKHNVQNKLDKRDLQNYCSISCLR